MNGSWGKASVLEDFGREAMAISESVGRFTFLVRSTAAWMLRAPIEWRQVLNQMMRIGVESLPVTTMTTFFTGMVLALQTGASSKHFFNEPLFVGTVVSFAIVMELAPVMTALVVAGRAARDTYGYLVCCGFVSMFAFSLALNMGMCLGVIPVAGIPLPLISYGGSSLAVTLWSLGIVANIYARRYALL